MKQIIENRIENLNKQLNNTEDHYTENIYKQLIKDRIELLQSILDEANNNAAEEKEKVYKVGDKFKEYKTKYNYILARINSNEVILICLEDGNRYTITTKKVQNDNIITKEEFKYICEGEDFELIS